ncbi:hypothetical protein BDE02_06G085900 [Populus trichocarpa]|nr:hypothetical protein BDE02_06G085900 [Populus trichocarpa]
MRVMIMSGKSRSAISTSMLRSFVMTEIYSVLKAYLFSLKKLCFLVVS